MSIKDILTSLNKGFEYGIEESLEFATQDHSIGPEIPEDISSLNYFYFGRECGKFTGGLVYIPLIDVLTLGIVPGYNIYKNNKLKKFNKEDK